MLDCCKLVQGLYNQEKQQVTFMDVPDAQCPTHGEGHVLRHRHV